MPTYFIYGGYLFSPLTTNLLSSTRGRILSLRGKVREWPTEQKQDVVVLVKVLAADFNRGDHSLSLWPVEKINGERFKTFQEFYEKMKSLKTGLIKLEDAEGSVVAIDVQKAKNANSEIIKRYHIKADKSIDLIP
jgi:hypothetical protein